MKNTVQAFLALGPCWRTATNKCANYLALMLFLCCCSVSADIIIQPVDPDLQTDPEIASYLIESNVLSDFVALIDENFAFEKALVVAMGSPTGPGYDQQSQYIKMPYAYFADAVKAQLELVEDENKAIERALNMVEYTLYHILGHALAGDSSIESDERADALATWAMVNAWPNGAEQWIKDVRAFAEASQKLDGGLDQYWHSHSLYKLRQEQLECWALGSNVEQLIGLFEAKTDSIAWASDCAQQWESLNEQSQFSLESVLLPSSVLRAPAK